VKTVSKAPLALIVASLVRKKQFTSVYDMQSGGYGFYSGQATEQKVSIFDFKNSCFITGNARQLYNFGTSSHINLSVKGSSFTGFDYESGSHFNGSVAGNTVTMYDFSNSQYTRYQVG
jgi:hypothetical protein